MLEKGGKEKEEEIHWHVRECMSAFRRPTVVVLTVLPVLRESWHWFPDVVVVSSIAANALLDAIYLFARLSVIVGRYFARWMDGKVNLDIVSFISCAVFRTKKLCKLTKIYTLLLSIRSDLRTSFELYQGVSSSLARPIWNDINLTSDLKVVTLLAFHISYHFPPMQLVRSKRTTGSNCCVHFYLTF